MRRLPRHPHDPSTSTATSTVCSPPPRMTPFTGAHVAVVAAPRDRHVRRAGHGRWSDRGRPSRARPQKTASHACEASPPTDARAARAAAPSRGSRSRSAPAGPARAGTRSRDARSPGRRPAARRAPRPPASRRSSPWARRRSRRGCGAQRSSAAASSGRPARNDGAAYAATVVVHTDVRRLEAGTERLERPTPLCAHTRRAPSPTAACRRGRTAGAARHVDVAHRRDRELLVRLLHGEEGDRVAEEVDGGRQRARAPARRGAASGAASAPPSRAASGAPRCGRCATGCA